MAKNTPLENHFLVVAYQSLGKNIKKDTWEGPKSIELVEKTAHRLGTFFELPNRFHLTQCALYSHYISIIYAYGMIPSKLHNSYG